MSRPPPDVNQRTVQPPEELVIVEDVSARPRSLHAYVSVGAQTIARAPLWWLRWAVIRRVPALPSYAVICGSWAGVIALLRTPVDDRASTIEAFSSPDAWLVSSGLRIGVGVTVVALAVLALTVMFRVAATTMYFGATRDIVRQQRRGPRAWWRSRTAFVGSELIQIGLTTGSVMFLMPVFRATLRVLATYDGTWNTTLFLCLAAGMTIGCVSYMRYLVAVASAYFAWRPAFFAATILIAIFAPWRDLRRHAPLWVGWTCARSAVAVVIGAVVVWILGSADGEFSRLAIGAVVLCVVAVAGFVVDSVADATLVAMVGHRLGDVRVSERRDEDEQRVDTEAVAASRRVQHVFEPPIVGIFVPASEAAYSAEPASIVGFDELLGPTVHPGEASRWEVVGAAPGAWRSGEVEQASSGAPEVPFFSAAETAATHAARVRRDRRAPDTSHAGSAPAAQAREIGPQVPPTSGARRVQTDEVSPVELRPESSARKAAESRPATQTVRPPARPVDVTTRAALHALGVELPPSSAAVGWTGVSGNVRPAADVVRAQVAAALKGTGDAHGVVRVRPSSELPMEVAVSGAWYRAESGATEKAWALR